MTTRHIENSLADIEATADNLLEELDSFEEETKKRFSTMRRSVVKLTQNVRSLREVIKEPA